ncbi:MAG TPA: ThiF family adenylyltransferase, partial [Kineosporiaceae bacterium]|nr:ThiF family adenylyltransferase [Kineosporiaceae bacterium]
RTYAERLTAANALEILRDYDVVLDGADNFPTRYLVDDACALLGIPDVWGSVLGFDGQTGVFWAPHGPTYRELFPQPPAPGEVPSCAEGGVLGALCASLGSIMVTEAVKLICGIGEPLVGRLLVVDALGSRWRTLPVRAPAVRRPVEGLVDDEAFCGLTPAPAQATGGDEVDARTLAAMLAARDAGADDLVLVDVREPHEVEIVAIPGAVAVPLGRIEADPGAVPADGRRVVLYCRSGARSARALALLRAAGRRDVTHLAGGVLAWVRDVEPDRPTY